MKETDGTDGMGDPEQVGTDNMGDPEQVGTDNMGDQEQVWTDDARAGLRAELIALGRGLDVPETSGATMAERVLAQLVTEAVPVPVAQVRGPAGRLERARAWARKHARVLAATLSGLLVVLVATPPVRAAVVDWFDFGGVEVRYAPSAPPTGGPPVPSGDQEARGPGCDVSVPMAEAERRAGFRPVVPGVLGAPDSVSVTGLPEGRSMVTLCWREGGRTIRLDEFASGLDPYFTKQVSTRPEWLKLNAGTGAGDEDGEGGADAGDKAGQADGLWFAEPHVLRFGMVGQDGTRWVRSERTAGATLLWVREERMTLRLEGVASRERAREVAESTL